MSRIFYTFALPKLVLSGRIELPIGHYQWPVIPFNYKRMATLRDYDTPTFRVTGGRSSSELQGQWRKR